MIYIIIFLALFFLQVAYFKLAARFNIVDTPNERSSHSIVTLRGGGVIFYLAVLLFFISSDLQYHWFFLGLTMMTVVSFLDDIFSLSSRIRLLIHFIAVFLLIFQLNLFALSWYYVLLCFIVVVGIINAYNFMDGINGITACYSIAVTGLLMILNHSINFVSHDLLAFSMLGLLVFAFFNFRVRARCFAGDVGSVTIAYILLFALASLIYSTGNLIYLLFLTVYGIDSVWTIISRLRNKENIFKPHRKHLYQIAVNEAGANMLMISCIYGGGQFLIGLLVIVITNYTITVQLIASATIVGVLSVVYLNVRSRLLRRFGALN